MPPYERERISEEFRQLADAADAQFRSNLRRLSTGAAAAQAHDLLLARSCVYGYLYDRHFLHSPELLLNELRWLLATRHPEAPRHALFTERFEAHRDELLGLLIARFQSLVDYRDELEPPCAPAPECPDTVPAHPRRTVR
jgi:hypothetical protein